MAHPFRSVMAWSTVLAAPFLAAEGTGVTSADLIGRVRAAGAGTLLSGASVTLVQEATGIVRRTSSDLHGHYAFRLLPVGNYTLRVEAPGFALWKRSGLGLQLGSLRVEDVQLQGAGEATVEVVASLTAPDATRTQVASVVDQDRLANLPINRRNFVDLSLVTPWATPVRDASGSNISGGAPDSGLCFLGASPRQNNFMVDGLDNNDLGNGSFRAPFSQEAIREFQVVSGGFSAEYGRALGGVVNAVTKSGTNQVSGSLFGYLRPGSWDAKSPVANGNTSDLRMRQYGATLGGPIVQDKLFYFVAMERMERNDQNVVTLDPQVVAILQGQGFRVDSGGMPTEARQTSFFGKLDYFQNDASHWAFSLIHSLDRNDNQIPWGGLSARSAGGSQDCSNLSVTLTHQWAFREDMVNDLKLLYASRNNSLASLDADGTVQVEIQGTATFGTHRLTPQDTLTTYHQLVDTLTLTRGDHTLKLGMDLMTTDNRGTVQNDFSGSYVFAALPATPPYLPAMTSLQAFQAGIPALFIQSFGNASTRFTTDNMAFFVQDEWKLHPTFLLKAGLRYDRERIPAFPSTSDYEALVHPDASRLPDGACAYSQLLTPSLDWSSSHLSPRLSFSWQPQKAWRVFGGYGHFVGATNLAPIFGARLINGSDVTMIVRSLADPYSLPPMLTWNNLDGGANRRYTTAPLTDKKALSIPGDYNGSVCRQAHMGLEWNPRRDMTFGLDLMHSRTDGILDVRNVNAFVAAAGQRPDPRYTVIYRVDGTGESRYVGQTLSWNWRMDPSFTLAASYTHSVAEDDYVDWSTVESHQSAFDPKADWGPSSQDQTHRFVLSGIYKSGQRSSALWRNWTVALIARCSSGFPYSQLAGYDRNGDGDPSSDRPEGVGRNSERMPWIRQLDCRIAKGFVWGARQLELSLDIFNLFNTANVLEVQNSLASVQPAYGTTVKYGHMRQLQMGARFSF